MIKECPICLKLKDIKNGMVICIKCLKDRTSVKVKSNLVRCELCRGLPSVESFPKTDCSECEGLGYRREDTWERE